MLRHSLEMQHLAEASDEDADGFVNYPLTVGEVEAVAMLKECELGVYRTSLRSKGEVNVAKRCDMIGGPMIAASENRLATAPCSSP